MPPFKFDDRRELKNLRMINFNPLSPSFHVLFLKEIIIIKLKICQYCLENKMKK